MRTMANLRLYVVSLSIALAAYATALPAQGVDFRLLKHLEERRTPAMTHVMSWTSNSLVLTPAVPIGLSVAGWAAGKRDMLHAGCMTGLSFATALVLTEGLKWTVQRPRPYLAYPDALHPVRTTIGYSFPSGHTSLTFATATSLCLCYPEWYVIAPSVIWAAGVGFSRLYLGVHYPSDVLTGALIGAASAVLVYKFSKNWWQYSPQAAAAFAIPVVISF